VVFGCSDSRVPAEIVFDQGLGDVFVVRNAGHVLDPSVLGTIEYGTVILGASLVVVLGHESCGAIAATAHTLATGEEAPGFVRTVVDRVMPSVARITAAARKRGEPEENLYNESLLRTEHVRHTVKMLHSYSVALRDRIADGSMAIVGTEYDLSTGRVHLVQVIGNVGDTVEHG
jgi:carbonic anhydrase